MADTTKTTYPDGNAGYPSDGNQQGAGKQGGQSDGQTTPGNPNTSNNPDDKKGNFR